MTLPEQWTSLEDHSPPYLTGNGFAVRCRYLWNYDGFKVNPRGTPGWVFVKTDYLDDYFRSRWGVDSFCLFTHNSDYPITKKHRRYLDDPRVRVWLAQNVELDHPKLKSLPIGIANAGYAHGDTAALDRIRAASRPKSRMFYANFALQNNPRERKRCLDYSGVPLASAVNGGWGGFAGGYSQPDTFEGYLEELARSYFCLSPRGNGIDYHRTWEALYVGTIPVVTRSRLSEEFSDFPMVVLRDWADFKTVPFSAELYEKIWNNFDTQRLHMDNYMGRIKQRYGL
jgi:hypothetical protein